jgi:biopolymer transport protein ExbD
MRGLSKRRSLSRARPVMNVTPLVDVVLVLLIIFMVVIPALSQGLDIEVPGIFHVDDETASNVDPFILSVTADGELYFDDAPVAAAELPLVMRAASRREPSRRLVIRADHEVRYATIRTLYRAVQAVGFPGVSLRVNQRQPGEAPSGAVAAR